MNDSKNGGIPSVAISGAVSDDGRDSQDGRESRTSRMSSIIGGTGPGSKPGSRSGTPERLGR